MKKKYIWKAIESATESKGKNWYFAIAIVAVGGAVASFIGGNTLFALLILIGGFTLMLSGSRPEVEHTYALSEAGVHVDKRVVPWSSIPQFCIDEDKEPKLLKMDTETLLGSLSIPLIDIDFRAVRTEFKNNNVDETDEIHSIVGGITSALGL